jgi:hypothetical protein
MLTTQSWPIADRLSGSDERNEKNGSEKGGWEYNCL